MTYLSQITCLLGVSVHFPGIYHERQESLSLVLILWSGSPSSPDPGVSNSTLDILTIKILIILDIQNFIYN